MTRSDILAAAERLINGDRAATYGDPAVSFDRIAALWSAYLGVALTAVDAANMLVLLKVSRAKGGGREDDFIDMAGYAALAGELAGRG